MTYVYFIQREDGCVKIGVTNNLKRRLRILQTGSNKKLKILAKFPYKVRNDAFRMERELHEKFAPFRQEGEWFHQGMMKDIVKNAIRTRHDFKALWRNIEKGRIKEEALVDAGIISVNDEAGWTWQKDLAKQRHKRMQRKYEQKFQIKAKQKQAHYEVIAACQAAGISTEGLPDHLLVKKLNGETI